MVIKTLSNRADLVSGGDVLSEVVLPGGVDPAGVRMTLNGSDVTRQFARRPNGRYMGRVSDLRVGANTLVARLPDGRGASLTVTNQPLGGPVLSGPQIQPLDLPEHCR